MGYVILYDSCRDAAVRRMVFSRPIDGGELRVCVAQIHDHGIGLDLSREIGL